MKKEMNTQEEFLVEFAKLQLARENLVNQINAIQERMAFIRQQLAVLSEKERSEKTKGATK